jgi:hypothetical protein
MSWNISQNVYKNAYLSKERISYTLYSTKVQNFFSRTYDLLWKLPVIYEEPFRVCYKALEIIDM